MQGTYRKLGDLPLVIPVFPLDGVLLLPGGQLPLNIFEPRYLNMLDDAMSGERIIGMVQTRPHQAPDLQTPALAPVGCAGRVTSFAETSDGRYLITLTASAASARARSCRCARPIARCEPTSPRSSRTCARSRAARVQPPTSTGC